MRNLKEIKDEFKSVAKEKIANGDFKVKSVEIGSIYKSGGIEIEIDGIDFKFSVYKDGTYAVDFSHLRIFGYSFDEKEEDFEPLKKIYLEYKETQKEDQIKDLEMQIEKLNQL